MYTLLKQKRLRCLGHVVRMDDGRIPKDLLYGELAQGKRPTGRLQLRYKDVCKRDLKALGIDINGWETLASNRSAWRQAVQQGLLEFEETLAEQAETKRLTRKARNQGEIREGTVIPELVFPATQGAVRELPIRARHHSLSRLKDANILPLNGGYTNDFCLHRRHHIRKCLSPARDQGPYETTTATPTETSLNK